MFVAFHSRDEHLNRCFVVNDRVAMSGVVFFIFPIEVGIVVTTEVFKVLTAVI